MNILLTNDDGIDGVGILQLAACLNRGNNVYIVAPKEERSACSHSITINREMELETRRIEEIGIDAYVLDANPVDCVKLGVEELLNDKNIDLIVSGMNKGANLATDIIYSGTVSAAMEGIMQRVPSVAISYDSHDQKDLCLEESWDYIDEIIKIYIKEEKHDVMLNINIPNLKRGDIQGVKICRLGKRVYKDVFERHMDEGGRISYRIRGEAVDVDETDETDTHAVKNGYISVTPLSFNMKSENGELIEKWLKK